MTGARAFVSGAAGGIGRAVVAELETRGMKVVGADLVPGDSGAMQFDVTSDGDVRDSVDAAAEALGGLDVVINIVGISGRSLGDGPVHEATDEAFDAVMETNVGSVFKVCRAAIPHLGEGSAIVNVSSVLGMIGGAPGLFDTHAYAASKGAVIALTRAMASTYAPRGIRINAVAPGLVRTPMSERARESKAIMDHTGYRQPLTGATIEPEQVAATVGFLASEESAAITGVVLPVDGGWTTT